MDLNKKNFVICTSTGNGIEQKILKIVLVLEVEFQKKFPDEIGRG